MTRTEQVLAKVLQFCEEPMPVFTPTVVSQTPLPESSPKGKQQNTRLDQEAVRLLEAIAERETGGNKSLAIRQMIREAAARRGIA